MGTALSYGLMFLAGWVGIGIAFAFDRWVHKHNWRGWSLDEPYEGPSDDQG